MVRRPPRARPRGATDPAARVDSVAGVTSVARGGSVAFRDPFVCAGPVAYAGAYVRPVGADESTGGNCPVPDSP